MTCSRVKVWRCCTRCAAQAEAAPPTMAELLASIQKTGDRFERGARKAPQEIVA